MADELPDGSDPPEFARDSSSKPGDIAAYLAPLTEPEETICPDCGQRGFEVIDAGRWHCENDACDIDFHPSSIEK